MTAAMSQAHQIVLDVDWIMEPVSVGIRRASAFAAFGFNAAAAPGLTDFQFPGWLKVSFFGAAITSEVAAELKRNFSLWLLGVTVRDALESFDMSLERAYRARLLARKIKAKQIFPKSRLKHFARGGTSVRIEILAADFSVQTSRASYLSSLQRLRNCLTHRMGLVSVEDTRRDDALVVKYQSIQPIVQFDGGDTQVLTLGEQPPTIREGQNRIAALRFPEETKRFVAGEVINLDENDARNIFWTIYGSVVKVVEKGEKRQDPAS